MGGQNNWAVDIDANDWMRSLEKRVLHEERRPSIRSAQDLLGPGFAPYAVQTSDWNGDAAARQGFWWSAPGALNSPDGTKTWMGETIVNADGSGIQEIQVQSMSSPPLHKVRTFQTVGGIRQYSAWSDVTGGGGAQGPAGPQGPPGPQGPAGPDGSRWYTDSATAIANGRVGDLYLDSAGHVWQKNSSGTWVDTGTDLSPTPDTTLLGYVYNQGSPVQTWDITHPLPFRPNVTVVDSAGSQVEGDIQYLTATTLRITFSAAFAGAAYLS